MLNNEKTIRFEDFAAVSQDGGDVLGKVLYYSLSSILIDRDELESLCDAVGFPKGRSNRTAMGDAFRSATGDIYERRVVKTDSGPQIFKVYCRDNKGGNASVISRELVKETVHEDINEYRKLANTTFNKTSKLFSYGAASPAAADHNPHVGHVPLFPDGCRRMERHWGRHADARRPLWRWKGRLYSGIPHGSHDDLLCQDWRRVECGGTDPRSGRTGQADQHL